jgi:FMN phosphatase YigB (HAD superfamily)
MSILTMNKQQRSLPAIQSPSFVIIFDMDGTLYRLDGDNNGFANSSLEAAVLTNSIKFVISQESCSVAKAKQLIALGRKDKIGISNFLAQRYGISRKQYFDIAWNINPKTIIKDFSASAQVVKQLKQSGYYLILLTSAPQIWQTNVIQFIGLSECFQRAYSGEEFGQKIEVFEAISQQYSTSKIFSVGDQIKTDILPAQTFGFETLLINHPNNLKQLLNILLQEETE